MNYLHFTFDGISSSKFNLFYTNQGEDLTFPFIPSFTDSIVKPMYQKTSYLAGVDLGDKKFNFKCWLDNASQDTLNNIRQWLDTEKVSTLMLDHEPNFVYNVKITGISDFTHYAWSESGVSFSFDITFTTLQTPYAISKETYTKGGVTPLGLPVEVGTTNVFLNYYPVRAPFTIDFNTGTVYNVKKNGVDVYNYPTVPSGIAKVDSSTGFFIRNNVLLEEYITSSNPIINKGGVFLDPTKNQITEVTFSSTTPTTFTNTDLVFENNLHLVLFVSPSRYTILKVTGLSPNVCTVVRTVGAALPTGKYKAYPAVGTTITHSSGTIGFRYLDKR